MIASETSGEVRGRFKAVPEQVFAAFVEAPGGLSPAPEITLTALQFDFRDGGGYRSGYLLPAVKPSLWVASCRSIEPPRSVSWRIEPADGHIESEDDKSRSHWTPPA
jgi:hypothetical protein